MNPLSDVFDGYLPGEYNISRYGKRNIDLSAKLNAYRRQLQEFNPLPVEELRLPPSQRFQEFMAMQANPEILAQSRMRLPQLPMGAMNSFM